MRGEAFETNPATAPTNPGLGALERRIERIEAENQAIHTDLRRYLDGQGALNVRINNVLAVVEQRGWTRGWVVIVALAAIVGTFAVSTAAIALVWMAFRTAGPG